MDLQFWNGRRVFLTGHTGFKGGWLALWLQSLGAEVTGYALEPRTGPSLFELARVADGMHSVIGDIRDAQKLQQALHAAAPEVVIHMAAQALVRESYVEPVETYAVNVMGTVHLLQAVRGAPSVRAVVSVTTDKVYENREWQWAYREIDRLGGHDPYSNSKACAELVTSAYRSSFFGPKVRSGHRAAIATARAGNVIGGGDWAPDRLIPDMLAAMERAEPVRIRHPQAIRPWQHVLEPLSGYLQLARLLCGEDGTDYADAWNFGPAESDAKPVQWIVEQMAARSRGRLQWQRDAAPQPHEATYLKLDCAKACNRLGWKPRWGLGVALEAIVDWHRHYTESADMRSVTLSQIADYQALLQP